VNVNESVPLKSAAGVWVSDGAVPESVPWAGGVATANVSAPPSGSEPVSPTASGVFSGVVSDRSSATGGRFDS
jgi:hypothetical protein